MVSIPLVQSGLDHERRDPAALNVHETYTVDVISRPARSGTDARPSTNAGDRRHGVRQAGRQHRQQDDPGLRRLRRTSTSTTSSIPGCGGSGRVFVGQRKDPFVVNLGETFDLVNIKYPATEFNPIAERATTDTLADKNVTSHGARSADRAA